MITAQMVMPSRGVKDFLMVVTFAVQKIFKRIRLAHSLPKTPNNITPDSREICSDRGQCAGTVYTLWTYVSVLNFILSLNI